jgi:hypothetical protein
MKIVCFTFFRPSAQAEQSQREGVAVPLRRSVVLLPQRQTLSAMYFRATAN